LLFCAALAWFPVTAGPGQPTIRVLLRYHDYTRDSSPAFERTLLPGLQQLGAPLLVGVVPFLDEPYPEEAAGRPRPALNLGPVKLAMLRESLAAGGVEVAQHGFSHQANFTIDSRPSEFAGLALARQREALAAGKASLEEAFGYPVRVFTPPFNVFDETTVTAMEQAGFRILSAGVRVMTNDSRLVVLPEATYPERMRAAVEGALQNRSSSDKLTVSVMHTYDFLESENPIPEFRKRKTKVPVAAFLANVRWAMAQPGARSFR
jgi:predicted deacetylase